MRTHSRVILVIIILTLSMGLVGTQSVFGIDASEPTSLHPVVVSLLSSVDEFVSIGTHTSDLEDGNWIQLSGGTSIKLPSLTLAYEGLVNAEYERDGVTVTVKSSFAEGEATYPLANHYVYSAGQDITATFWGNSAVYWSDVDFRLIKISSITEARDLLTSAFQGDLAPLRDKLEYPTWNTTSDLDIDRDATETIPAQSVGNYLLLVTKTPSPYELYIYSATVVEVLDQTLQISAPSSIKKGDPLKVNTGLTGTYLHGAILIKESVYSGEVKLVTDGTILSTELRLNDVLMADGAFIIDSPSPSIEDAILLLNQITNAFGSNQIVYDYSLISGSMSLSTSSLATGDYVLLVGVYNVVGSRIVGVKQTTVKIYTPSPTPPINILPVAEAGPDQKAWVDTTVYFDGSKSTDPDGSIISWTWDFGDGETASGETASHIYPEPGIYTVTLTVQDSRLAVASDTCKATISEPPKPVTDELVELVPGGEEEYLVDATEEANTTVTINTTDPVTVTVIKYESNPHPQDPLPATALPNYVDVEVSDPDAVTWPIYVEMSYTDDEIGDLDENTFGIYYWKDEAWTRCSNTGVNTMSNIVWAYMTAEEAAGSPILIAGTHVIIIPPLSPFLSELTVTPSDLEQGDDVTISLDIMNPNNQSITYQVTMQIGWLTLLVDVELEALESKTVSRTLTMGIVGDYSVTVDGMTGSFVVNPPLIPLEPAEFVVSDLEIQPDECEEGEDVTFTVLVENIGETEGSYIVEFRVDGDIVDTQIVTLAAGSGSLVHVRYEALSAGTYQVSVGDLTERFLILEPPEPEYEVSELTITPEEIELGDEVTISFVITNLDSRSYVFVPFVQIGETMIMEDVELEGHESRTVTHTITPESVGDYDVTIDGLEGSFTVSEEPVQPFWMQPGYMAGILIIIVSVGAIIYLNWKGKLSSHPSLRF